MYRIVEANAEAIRKQRDECGPAVLCDQRRVRRDQRQNAIIAGPRPTTCSISDESRKSGRNHGVEGHERNHDRSVNGQQNYVLSRWSS